MPINRRELVLPVLALSLLGNLPASTRAALCHLADFFNTPLISNRPNDPHQPEFSNQVTPGTARSQAAPAIHAPGS